MDYMCMIRVDISCIPITMWGKEEKYVTDLNFLESDKLLVLYFNCDSNAYLFFYNKENKRQILTVDNEKAFFRPMAICNDNILFVEMNDSCNMVSKYRVLMD